jgi:hypothetical protein
MPVEEVVFGGRVGASQSGEASLAGIIRDVPPFVQVYRHLT